MFSSDLLPIFLSVNSNIIYFCFLSHKPENYHRSCFFPHLNHKITYQVLQIFTCLIFHVLSFPFVLSFLCFKLSFLFSWVMASLSLCLKTILVLNPNNHLLCRLCLKIQIQSCHTSVGFPPPNHIDQIYFQSLSISLGANTCLPLQVSSFHSSLHFSLSVVLLTPQMHPGSSNLCAFYIKAISSVFLKLELTYSSKFTLKINSFRKFPSHLLNIVAHPICLIRAQT